MSKDRYIHLNIEKLPEGYYTATSPDVQGLVAQGKTFEEVVEVAEDLAKILLRAQKKSKAKNSTEHIFYPLHITV